MSDLMKVKLPDGTVIEDVPKGITQEQLMKKVRAAGYDTSWYTFKDTPVPEQDPLGVQTATDLRENTTAEGVRYEPKPAPAAAPAPAPASAKPAKKLTPLEEMRQKSQSTVGKDASLRSVAEGVLGAAATVGNSLPGVSKVGDYLYGEEGRTKGALKEMDEMHKDDLGYKVGKIGAEVGLTLAPGQGAYRATKTVLSMLPKSGAVGKFTVPVLAEFGGNAAAGATGAALTDSDVVQGAALGGILGTGATGAIKGYDALGRVLEGSQRHASRHLRDVIGQAGNTVDYTVNTLRNTGPIVPGEQATAGLAALGQQGGPSMPWLKTLEENARRRLPAGKFNDIDRANEAARLKVLEPTEQAGRDVYDQATGTVMQSPLKQIRETVTDPLYKQANPNMVYMRPQLENIIREAEVRGAALRGEGSYGQARANAAGAGRTPPPAAIPMAERGGAIPGPMMGPQGYEPPWTQLPMRSIDDLQRAKNYLTKEIDTLSRSTDSAGLLRLSQLRDARRQLTQSMRAQSPDYDKASSLFSQLSAPQNQSDIYHQLATALRNPTGAAGERYRAFLTAKENAPRTLQRAGLPRFEHLEQALTPTQMADVNTLTRSLRRKADYESMPLAPGAVPEFISPAQRLESRSPPFLERAVTLTRHILKKFGASTDEQVREIIDEAMTDPNKLADLIELLPPDIQREFRGRLATASGLMAQENSQRGE